MKPHSFHPEADKEYEGAGEYQIKFGNVGQLYDKLDKLIIDARKDPELYSVLVPPVRRRHRKPFPYAILYVNEPERIFIVAVMHMKRELGYWKDRL